MLNTKQKILQTWGLLGGYKIARWLTRATPKILMYHRFSLSPRYGYVHREIFEKQVAYLHRYFNVISMGSLLNYTRESKSPPKNTVVITVDDGYLDFYDIAYPILKKYGMPATFFVPTRFIDGEFWLWPDRIRYILDNSTGVSIQNVPGAEEVQYECLTDQCRLHLWKQVIALLLSLEEEEKKQWLHAFAEKQGVLLPDRPKEYYRAVSWNHVRELHSNNIEIGSHSMTHPSLARMQEGALLHELQGSFDVIADNTGQAPACFCYPNGQPYDYTEAIKMHLKDIGYRGAVTAFYDRHINEDIYELRRFKGSENWFEFLKSVNGVEALMAQWLDTDNIISVDNIVNEVTDL